MEKQDDCTGGDLCPNRPDAILLSDLWIANSRKSTALRHLLSPSGQRLSFWQGKGVKMKEFAIRNFSLAAHPGKPPRVGHPRPRPWGAS